ncbi:MAG: hypothetical protein M1839_008438 [Geoglossum umbratile]|nr:MAG: hypothetical protein M1839_008438 [Geoglossum umbratile]
MPTAPKRRILILTGAIAAITVTGTLYGAGLKTQRDMQHVHKLKTDAMDREALEGLLRRRERLVGAREEVRRKIGEVGGRGEGRR